MTVTAEVVAARLETIRTRIAATGCEPGAIRVIAVTKSFGADVIAAAVGAGLRDIGENYGQELLAKATAAPPDVRWHFLGAVQRRKVAALAPLVHLWHAVDRRAAGEEIARRAPGASVLVEVNVSGLPNRAGASEAETPALVEALRALDLDVAGLMAVASGDAQAAPHEFERVARLREALGLRELSMGMTDDFELAVAAGSTMIRIGRALFGARPQPGDARR